MCFFLVEIKISLIDFSIYKTPVLKLTVDERSTKEVA